MKTTKRGQNNGKFKIDLKCRVLDMISGLPMKPTGKPYSNREVAKIAKRKLDVKVSDKSIAKWRKTEELLRLQPAGSNDYCVRSAEELEFEEELEAECESAFRRANLTLGKICMLANHISQRRSRLSSNKVAKKGRKWARGFTKRRGWTYRRVMGSKLVLDEQLLEKADAELTTILKDYDDNLVINTDESSVGIRDIGDYSFQKKSDTTQGRTCNAFLGKARITILQFISKAGNTIWKNTIIDNHLTRGLPRDARNKIYDRNGQIIRLLPNGHLHCTTDKGYITRGTFFAILGQLNDHYKRMGQKAALVLDNLSSHFSNYEEYKAWKSDTEKTTCIYQDNETLTNIRLIYLPSRTTGHAQPLDQGYFAKIQTDFRVWLNSQLFDEREPTKLECVMKTYELMSSMPQDYTKACWKRTGLKV